MDKQKATCNMFFKTNNETKENLETLQKELSKKNGTKLTKTQTLEYVLHYVVEEYRKND